MAFALSAADGPLADVNTTPLIDVMLVLLTMIMLSIPLSTHSLDYDLPSTVSPPPVTFDPVRNRLTIDASDRVSWNGTTVTNPQLAAILKADTALKPEPVLEFAPDPGASYDASAAVLRLVKASGVTNFGFVGNEKHRLFER